MLTSSSPAERATGHKVELIRRVNPTDRQPSCRLCTSSRSSSLLGSPPSRPLLYALKPPPPHRAKCARRDSPNVTYPTSSVCCSPLRCLISSGGSLFEYNTCGAFWIPGSRLASTNS